MALFGLGKKKKKGKKAEGEEDAAAEEKEEGEEKEEAAEKGDAKGEGEGGEAKEGEEGAEGGGGKKSKKKIIIIGILALVLIGGGAGGAYYAGLFGGGGEDHGEKKEKDHTQAVYYTMPEFLVNLNASGKSASFLKTTVVLQLSGQTDVLTVEANLPRLMDAFNTYLRELRSSDLAGSAGIQRLREELLLRTNKTLAPLEVNDVLFKEIVVQ